MSFLLGLYLADGRRVGSAELDRMRATLSHRGAVHSDRWFHGRIGLAASYVQAPSDDGIAGSEPPLDVAVAADARIDNAEELARMLVPDRLSTSVSPERIILEAYLKWGHDSPSRLLGEFAFAIWDARKNTLFCARDFAGIRPFYFAHVPGKFFAFGSEIKALLSLGDVDRSLDETRVGDYLTQIVSDPSSTFYSHVRRLPAGHSLLMEDGRIRESRWFAYDSNRETQLSNDSAYAEAFGELFRKAVRRCVRPGPLGIALSGGLDSTSIACVVGATATGNVHADVSAYSAVFKAVPECDERAWFMPIVERYHLPFVHVLADDQHPLGHLGAMLSATDQPFTAPNASMMWMIYAAAGKNGVSALLNGHGGDEIVSQGYGRLKELAHEKAWLKLRRELKLIGSDNGPGSSLMAFLRYGLAVQPNPSFFDRVALRAVRAVLRRRVDGTREDGVDAAHPMAWLAPEFVKRTQIDARLREWRNGRPESASTERERHRLIVSDPGQQLAFEVMDALGFAHSVSQRFPFWDRELVEFCLALPSDQKLRNGYGRYILRTAMKNVLPEAVRLRRGKTDFTPNLVRAIVHTDRSLLEPALDDFGEARAYIDPEKVHRSHQRILDGVAEPLEVFSFQNILTLLRWLQSRN